MLFGVRLCCLFGMSSSVNEVASRRMSMVCCFLVMSGLVVLGRFRMVARRVRVMF